MAKKFEIQETPFGICDDPNVLKAPQGALNELLNCELRRDGAIQPIYGVNKVDVSGTNLTYMNKLFNFDNDLLLCDVASGTDYFEFLGNIGNELLDEDSGHPAFFTNYYNAQESRGNLYICCDDGVRKVTGASSTDLFVSGLMPDVCQVITSVSDWTGQNWWTTSTYIKYVCTLQRTDANNNVVESAISVADSNTHAGGADRVPIVYISIGPTVQAGDVVRLFRTPMAASAAATGSRYYLAAEITVTSADVTNRYLPDYYDTKDEADLSESLYVNPENEGMLQNNWRAPAAKCIAQYKGSTFYANVVEISRANLVMETNYNDLEGNAIGAGGRSTICTLSSGSAVLTGVTDTTGLEIGQLAVCSGIPADSYVINVNVGASEVTISNNCTSTGADTVYFHDTITFGYGSTYETYTACTTEGSTNNHNAYELARNLIKASGSDYISYITEPGYNDISSKTGVTIERRALNSSTFYIWATHGESYEPQLSGPTYSGGLVFSTSDGYQSDMNAEPARYYWSKNKQPEHVPIVNWDDCGDSSPIRQVVAIKDGLLVFKDDGIYVVEGEGAQSGWSERLLDKDNFLVASDCVIAVGNVAYAITNHGLVKVDIYGVTPISRYYINYDRNEDKGTQIESSIDASIAYITNRVRAGSSTPSAWIEYDERFERLLFTLPTGASYATSVFSYNLVTQSFARISYDDNYIRCMICNRSDSMKLYVGGYNLAESGVLYKSSDVYSGSYYRANLAVPSGDGVTIDFFSVHNASVGDIVVVGAYRATIATIVDSDTVTVDDNTGIGGVCSIYTPLQAVVRWSPKFGSTRAFRKNFIAYAFLFDALTTYSTSGSLDKYEVDFESGGSSYGPREINDNGARGNVPIAYARQHTITPAIYITAVNILWSLVGLELEYYMQAPRGSR